MKRINLEDFVLNTALVVVLLCLFITCSTIIGHFFLRDSTDGPYGRSGLRFYTDHKTGVQYVGNSGGVTPRLNADGSLVVVEKVK